MGDTNQQSARSPVLRHLRSVMITGLLTVIPLFITVYILHIVYGLVTTYTQGPAKWVADKLLTPWAGEWIEPETLREFTVPIFAILISLLIVYLLGLLGTFFVGRKIIARFEHFISNLPLIKGIYGTTKQVMAVFRQGGGGAGFQRVVLVQFPRAGTWTVAFVTNTVKDPVGGQNLVCCFIPLTPNPTSGFFQMFPEIDVRNTDWTVDLGIKIVLSGGLLAPPVLDQGKDPLSPTATETR
ncbi:MAG: DUF502 domain-containing protein [Phycisphaerales bacterium]|nr:DUF502 domain-containing protein [Phycisphaerales bacterium]